MSVSPGGGGGSAGMDRLSNAAWVLPQAVYYRTGELGKGDRKTGDMFPGMLVAEPDDFRAYHFVDAVVAGGSVRADLSGLHVGPVKRESSARAAADHLADELERFCKQNHAALTRGRTETRPNEP